MKITTKPPKGRAAITRLRRHVTSAWELNARTTSVIWHMEDVTKRLREALDVEIPVKRLPMDRRLFKNYRGHKLHAPFCHCTSCLHRKAAARYRKRYCRTRFVVRIIESSNSSTLKFLNDWMTQDRNCFTRLPEAKVGCDVRRSQVVVQANDGSVITVNELCMRNYAAHFSDQPPEKDMP